MMNKLLKDICSTALKYNNTHAFHTSSPVLAWSKSEIPKNFLRYNKKVFPPQEIGEEPRPAVSVYYNNFIFYCVFNILITTIYFDIKK